MFLLSRADMEKVFSIQDAIQAVEEGFCLFSAGKVSIPQRTVIPSEHEEGTFLFMPAYCGQLGAASLKIVDVFPHNHTCGLPTTPAQVLLMDDQTGIPFALLDGTYVTQLRTGAASGAAIRCLARKDCRKGALIGAGGQAEAQLRAMLAARDLDEVAVFDANKNLCGQFVERLSQTFAGNHVVIRQADSGDEAVSEADVIITVTPSKTPVFHGETVKDGAIISAVGSYKPDMQEIDPKLVERVARIYCDSQEAVLAEAGDIIRPLEQGVLSRSKLFADLGEVLLGQKPGRMNEQEILLFETVGIGIQDLITAHHIYHAARKFEEPIGYEWG